VMISDMGMHLLGRWVSQEGKAPRGGDGDRNSESSGALPAKRRTYSRGPE